jgi:hypothetical protein
MSTLPEIKWIKQNNQFNSTSNAQRDIALYVTKTGTLYAAVNISAAVTGTGALIGGADISITKWDPSGTRQWIFGGSTTNGALLNSTGSDLIGNIHVDSNEDIYVGSYSQSVISGITGAGDRDGNIQKFRVVSGALTRLWGIASPISSAAGDSLVKSTVDPVSGAAYLSMRSAFTSVWTGGGIAYTGSTGTAWDIIIGKVSTNGTVEWVIQSNQFNTTSTDDLYTMAVGPDGHLVVAYETSGGLTGFTGTGGTDVVLMKVNKDTGAIMWKKRDNTFNSNGNEGARDLRFDLDGNIYLAYYISGALTGTTDYGSGDVCVAKFTPTGQRLWITRSPLMNTASGEYGVGMDVDTSGNAYVLFYSAGTLSGQPKIGGNDVSLARINNDGTVAWVWTPTQLNTTADEGFCLNFRLVMDKYRNMYLGYMTGIPLAAAQTTGISTTHNYVLAKLGPVEQISYDPADAIPPTPTLTNTTVTSTPVAEDSVPNGLTIDSIITSLGANYVSTATNRGIAIYAANITNGTWQYSLNNGTLWTNFPAVSTSSYLMLNGASTIIRYIPNANSNDQTSISYVAWNGLTHTAGTTAAITIGDGTPFSSGNATTIVNITPINDAPSMSSAVYVLPNLSTVSTETGVTLESIKNTFNIADIDNTSLGLAFITADNTLGNWEYSEDSGSSWTSFSTVSTTNALHLDILTTLIRFVPTTSESIGTTSLTFVAWDKSNSASIVNKRGNATLRGGANAYSPDVGTLSRTIIAPPSVPRSVKAVVGTDSITFSWTAPIFYGYGTAEDLTYTLYDSQGTVLQTTSSTSVTIENLTITQPYQYSISAKNSFLEGSATSTIGYLGTPVLNDIERSHMELELSWSAPATQGSVSSSITYTILDENNLVVQSNITDTSYIFNTNLTGGTSKTYKIQATSSGVSSISNSKTAVVPFIPVPSHLSPELANGQITISWNNTSSLVQGATFQGYKIYYRKDGFEEYVTSLIDESTTTITGLGGEFDTITLNGTAATFTSLTNGALYKFRIVTVVTIDGVSTDSSSSTTIRAIPLAAEISVTDLSSVISIGASGGDTSAAVSVVSQLAATSAGVNTVAQSFASMANGSAEEKSKAGAVFVGLPLSSAAAVLSSVIANGNASAKAQLLQQAISNNPTQVGSIISNLGTIDDRKSAITSAVSSIVSSSPTTSLLSAAASTGIITDATVASAVGAADIAARITVSTIKSSPSSVVTNFSSSISDAKNITSEQKTAIMAGAADALLKSGAAVTTDATATAEEKTSALANVMTAVLTEANGDDDLKNTFVQAIGDNFPGQVVPLSGETKTQLLASIPVERIDTTLLNPAAPLSLVVPVNGAVEISPETPNQFLVMKLDTVYTFNNKDNPSDTPISVTYKQVPNSSSRYLEFADGSQLSLGQPVTLFGKTIFLAAAAGATINNIEAPSAPTIDSIVPGNQTITITFTAPTSDGGSTITGYKYSTDGTTYTTATVSGNEIIISGLTNGTSYSVTIKATNVAGDSVASNSLSSTPRTTPSAPVINSITEGNQTLTVNFTAPSTGGSAITGYKYSIDGTNYSTAIVAGSSIIITTNLTNGTSYPVTIKATNVAGDSNASNSVTAIPKTVPSAPTINSIAPENGQVVVTFTESASTGGTPITGYKYSINGTTYSSAVIVSNTITITGLMNGTAYPITLKATNTVGDSLASNSITSTPRTVPTAPTITSIAPGNEKLIVSFSPPFSTGGSPITGYKYSVDGTTYTEVASAGNTLIIPNLINEQIYSVTIKAVNAAGDSDPSSSMTGKPSTTGQAIPTTLIYGDIVDVSMSDANDVNFADTENYGHRVSITVDRSKLNEIFHWTRSIGAARPSAVIGTTSGFRSALITALGSTFTDIDGVTGGLHFGSANLSLNTDTRIRKNSQVSANDIPLAFILYKIYGNSSVTTLGHIFNLQDAHDMLTNETVADAIIASLQAQESGAVTTMFRDLLAADPKRFFNTAGVPVTGIFETNTDVSGSGSWGLTENDIIEIKTKLVFKSKITRRGVGGGETNVTVSDGTSTQKNQQTIISPGDYFYIRLQLKAADI